MNSNKVFKVLQSYSVRVVSFIVLIISIMLFYLIPFVDDVPYYETIEESVVDIGDFKNTYDNNDGRSVLSFETGRANEGYYSDVSLEGGDVFCITLKCDNGSDKDANLTVDLYEGPEYDLSGVENKWTFGNGMTECTTLLPYYRTDHPQKCQLRLFSDIGDHFRITDLSVKRYSVKTGNNPIVFCFEVITGILFIVSLLIFLYNMIFWLKGKPWIVFLKENNKKSTIQEVSMYLIITVIMLVTLFILYRHANIFYPIVVEDGDAMGVFYYGKLLDEYGPALVGHRTGGIWGADMYDYPYSDSLSFFMVKIISFFSDNPYLTINIFYFLCFILAAYSCAISLRYLGIGRITTIVLSTLYGFMPYLQMRYSHMWLIPCFFIPPACVMAMEIITDRLNSIEDKGKREHYFFNMILISFFCAFTGMYYAFFICMMIAASFVIMVINTRNAINKCLYPIVYGIAVFAGVVANIIPNYVYYCINGVNPHSETAIRGRSGAEVFGLKIIQLLLPQRSHRIPILKKIASIYANEFPMVNENEMSSLGIVAAIGFTIAIILLFRKESRNKEISYLCVACVLMGTIGGAGSVLSLFLKWPIRCYNRMSVIFMFIGLYQIGVLLNLLEKKLDKRLFVGLSLVVLAIGLFDQTYTFPETDYRGFQTVSKTIHEIEKSVPDGSLIFELPYGDWPSGITYRSFIGYVESDKVRWSYGAMQGREEAEWQKRVASSDTESMIKQLRDEGYAGIYVDMGHWKNNESTHNSIYSGKNGSYVKELKKILGEPTFKNDYWDLYFWKI